MGNFNPNEEIEIKDELEFKEDLVADDLQKELKEGTFGKFDVQDFSEFNTKDYFPEEGRFIFSLEQKWLKVATSITKLTSSGSGTNLGVCKIILFKDKIKLSSFNQMNFSEVFLPLKEEIELDQEISFIFDLGVLRKISKRFNDAVITFEFDAKKKLLLIKSGKSELQLSTYSEEDFVPYHEKIGDIKYLGKINTRVLKEGVKYISQFVKRNDMQLALSLAECRKDYLVGGNNSSIGVFKYGFDLNFKIKFEVLSILDKILPHLHNINSHLFESENFYILRDENLYFGFEKIEHEFPPVESYLEAKTTADITLIPRGELLNSLHRLSVVSLDKDLLVKCNISGNDHSAELKLITKDMAGRESKDILSVNRMSEEKELKDRDFNLNINNFIKTVSYFNSANVQLEEIEGKSVIIKDYGEDYETVTFLVILED